MEVFNRSAALERAGGDAERLEELLEDFKIKFPAMIAALERAAEKKRAPRIHELAEEMRALSVMVGAEGMVALADQLLEAAATENHESVETLLTHAGMELDWLLRILDENRCSGNL